MFIFVQLLGCTGDSSEGGDDEDSPIETDTTLTLPNVNIDGVDSALFIDSVELVMSITGTHIWASIDASMESATPSCPHVYLGEPNPDDVDLDDFDGVDDDFLGYSWFDRCANGDVTYNGVMLWDTTLQVTDNGASTDFDGSRMIAGQATVNSNDTTVVRFSGYFNDTLSVTQESSKTTVNSYAMNLDGVVGGTGVFGADSPTPDGMRATLNYSISPEGVAVTGGLNLMGAVVSDRFDSWAFAVDTAGKCADEPDGWIAVRANDGFWFELDYETPLEYDDTGGGVPTSDPYSKCDGCGILYVRGVDSINRQVVDESFCPDFSGVWGSLVPPDHTEYVYEIRQAN